MKSVEFGEWSVELKCHGSSKDRKNTNQLNMAGRKLKSKEAVRPINIAEGSARAWIEASD